MRSRISARLFVITLAMFAAVQAASRAHSQEIFKADPIESFDGKTWSGLTIGESTTDVIKKRFKTSKGAVRPEAMLLPQPEKAPIRIDVLMHGRGGGSIL